MNYSELLYLRYIKPLETLLDGWFVKALIAFGISIGTIALEMFATNAELVVLLGIAIIVDLLTGVASSRRNEIPITSLGFRQSFVKTIEYALILIMVTGISNTFEGTVPMIEHFDVWAYFFAIITEMKSILENLTKGRESRAKEVWEYVIKRLMDKIEK